MTTTYIPYKGQSTQGTWKLQGQRVTAYASGMARGRKDFNGNTMLAVHTDTVRNKAFITEKTGSWKWLMRSVIWFVSIIIILYAWNGFVLAQSRTTSYRVKSGDTLWSVAKHEIPNRDPRAVISQIQRLNHISGTDYIYPGEVLKLPQG